ncbi:hypothetical protein [Microbulbifer sp. TYP-18]|uniref:hypothetical protein n=1 Tax=Microbulbifer sp. TYP-18 TaxID=3230024 RepID=UPI0034C61A7D
MWLRLLVACCAVPALCVGSYTMSEDALFKPNLGQSPTLSFCQQRFYREDDGRLSCNWAVNFNFACFISRPSNIVIQAGAKISEPEIVGECDNGEPVIKLFHY